MSFYMEGEQRYDILSFSAEEGRIVLDAQNAEFTPRDDEDARYYFHCHDCGNDQEAEPTLYVKVENEKSVNY